ncbi:protoheme IX farnesyltransferase [Cerasibacillus terrae]|uniref:Protoheme IX farnesyltransferase n=1 Tax=Cerasibacillus terrae TaxID=2498845 RepID=A0A5C8NVQ7_9BACI|nr:heme o synthase [Cerasibacillus terrae]TXL65182.1 protoheme IX farnesyltransferase [Cerasibacillus terrae]
METRQKFILHEHENNTQTKTPSKIASIFADLKALLKLVVLIINVMPVVTGYLLALHFSGESLTNHIASFIITIVGSFFVIAGALILNNWYEADLDKHMKRTKRRPTVTGNFSLHTVLKVGIISSIIGFVFLMFTTWEATLYAFIGWFTYVVLYTFWTKRKYTLNTVVGSVSGAVTPLIGWAVIAPSYHIVPVMLFIILFIWQIPHTFAIAMRRYDDYKRAGVPMLPVVAGFEVTKRQMLVWIITLFPIPFFLFSLGKTFVIIATILNILWIILAIRGFFMKDDIKWANMMFRSSLQYLTILFGMMIIISLF